MSKFKGKGKSSEDVKDTEEKDVRYGKNRKNGAKSGKSKWKKDASRSSRNDVSWYTPDPQLLLDTGRWPYSRPVGTPLSRSSLLHIADGSDDAVPGIAACGLINTIGRCSKGSDAPNVAANAVYTFVRHTNAGSRNYDANDLMLYIMAMDSIYTAISWITRVYATVGMYSDMNKYLPEALASAQYVDLASIRENMANFRTRVNSRILKVGALVVPDTMAIFKRHSWIYQNYYSEGDNIKDQIYFYYPNNFYIFQLDASGAGMLKNVPINDFFINGKMTADSFINLLDAMITPIFNDEDFNIMGGDILKAYDKNILRLMLLPDLLIAQPVNNFEVLQQFKNMQMLPMPVSRASGNFDIVQDTNKEFLINQLTDYSLFMNISLGSRLDSVKDTYADEFRIAYDELSRPRLLTSESHDVSPAENMVNTRLTSLPEMEVDSSATGLGIHELAFGTEIARAVDYYWYDKSWTLNNLGLTSVITYDPSSVSDLGTIEKLSNVISSFRFHPAHSFVGCDDSTSPATYIPSALPNFEIDNFTTIDYDHIDGLHQVAILGEFNVPRLAVVK